MSICPREAVITGSTLTSLLSLDRSPPTKSTTKRQAKSLCAQVLEHFVRERLTGVKGHERALDIDRRETVEQEGAALQRVELKALNVELEQRRGTQVTRSDEGV